ncbi:MAG TPA: hypothetical protein VFQ35_08160, partial [Polyangiaceae bacterium]|nr:hypothetical protein [Polyangiaceae bacterium]
MRVLVTSLILMSASSLRVCGSEGSGSKAAASAEVAVSANAAATAPLAKASFGGRVVAVGQHSVELALHQSGLVEARVVNADGKLVSDGVALSVAATTKAQGSQEIKLAFVPPKARFEGQAAAGVELTGGPAQITLSVDGKEAKAALQSIAVLKAPEFGGSLLVVGDYGAEVLARADGEVLAFLRDAHGAAVHG